MERDTPHSARAKDQSYRARLGQLLRAVLPDRVGQISQKHRQVPGALGNAEVQATEGPPHASLGIPGGRVHAPAGALRSLANPKSQRPDGGSRMTGDCHVRFCESPRVKSPRATHQPTEHIAKRRRHAEDRALRDAPWPASTAQGSGVSARSLVAAPLAPSVRSAAALRRRRPSRTSQAHLLSDSSATEPYRGWASLSIRLWRPVRVGLPTSRALASARR